MIIGTAGHVDHGKTCLIKALTGADTDRLREEKKRGITIELGFANLPNEKGLDIGIIDVPGHEKFARHMLAGIGGIDLVLLVIAADEGIMPQTAEHLEVLKMLRIDRGILVLTKTDLVEEDWIQMVREDVRDYMKGSFLEQAPMVEVSSRTGENVETLKAIIFEMAKGCGSRRIEKEVLRIPVDRIFTIDGFGTVVTGTLTEGSIEASEEVMLYPSEKTVRVRSLQVHGSRVKCAYAGQRIAVNLSSIKKEDIQRGDVLAAPYSMETTRILDVRIDLFYTAEKSLQNGSRLHLYYGAAEVLCKAILLNQDILEAGQAGYAQLRLEKSIAVKRGDRFIIRFYSPMITIGGGVILDAAAPKRKRYNNAVLAALKIRDEGSDKEVLEQILREESRQFTPVFGLAISYGRPLEETRENLDQLCSEGKARQVEKELFLHEDYLEEIEKTARNVLQAYHTKYPLNPGMVREELRARLREKLHLHEMKYTEPLIQLLIRKKVITEHENLTALGGFSVQYTESQLLLRGQIENTYKEAGYLLPETDAIIAAFDDKYLARQIIDSLCSDGSLVRLDSQNYIHSDAFNQAMQHLDIQLKEKGQITLAEYRDLLGTSRKYAMLLLNYADRQKITRKIGDVRIP